MADETQDDAQDQLANRETVSRIGSIVAAFGLLLGFILVRLENGLPRTSAEIAVVAGVGAVAVVALVLAVNELLVAENRQPWIHGVRSLSLLAIVACALLAGAFAGLAPADDEVEAPRGSAAYAKELQLEIDELQGAGTLASAQSPSSRQAYARKAHAIGAVYEEVVADLRLFDVDRRDRPAHWFLVRRVAAAGRAYHHLGEVVSEHAASVMTVNTARARVATALAAVGEAIERLEGNGYRVQAAD